MVQCHVLALDKMISRNLHSSLYGQITIQNRLAVGNRDLILIWVVQASSLHISSVMLFTTTTHHEIFNWNHFIKCDQCSIWLYVIGVKCLQFLI